MTISIPNKQKIKLLNSDDVFAVMQQVLLREQKIDQDKEHFWMIGLDNANRLLYIEMVSMGSVNSATVEPMNVYRFAVQKGAIKVVFVHNHPSGELKPSAADLDLTDRLIQVGRILNIEAIDHLIISKKSYLSFADTDLFEKLKQSTKWVPQYELIQRIKAEQKSIQEQAVKEAVQKTIDKEEKKRVKDLKMQSVAVAKQLKARKLPLKEIMAITGLSKAEIEKIR